jgi:hypothetical protein
LVGCSSTTTARPHERLTTCRTSSAVWFAAIASPYGPSAQHATCRGAVATA